MLVQKLVPKLGISGVMLCLLMLGGFSTVKADSVYLFTMNNFGQVGSLGSVTTHVLVASDGLGNVGCMLVTVAINPNYVIHGSDALGWNVASGFTGAHVLADGMGNVLTTPGDHFTTGDGGTFDGFGSRPFSIDGETTSSARSHLEQTFSFIFCADQAFTDSAQLSSFAAQIALLPSTGATGFAATGGPGTPTPEPTAMLLLGSGLLGLAARLRRRGKNSNRTRQ